MRDDRPDEPVVKQKLPHRMQFIVQMQSDMENPVLDRASRRRAAEQLRELGDPIGQHQSPDPMGGALQFWEWREAREIRRRLVNQRNVIRRAESQPELMQPIEDPELRRREPPLSTPWEELLRD
jgi:hypothetical protein